MLHSQEDTGLSAKQFNIGRNFKVSSRCFKVSDNISVPKLLMAPRCRGTPCIYNCNYYTIEYSLTIQSKKCDSFVHLN